MYSLFTQVCNCMYECEDVRKKVRMVKRDRKSYLIARKRKKNVCVKEKESERNITGLTLVVTLTKGKILHGYSYKFSECSKLQCASKSFTKSSVRDVHSSCFCGCVKSPEYRLVRCIQCVRVNFYFTFTIIAVFYEILPT